MCKRASEKGEITTKQKWLGIFHAKEIRDGFAIPHTIEKIDDEVGFGVFAKTEIAPFSYIGEYSGLVRKRARKDKSNDYCFSYFIGEGIETPFIIDAKEEGSFTRFINHSSKPNLTPLSVLAGGVMHLILVAASPISAGTQLVYDYGEEYWAKRKPPRELTK